ncbi:hypothetical protein A3L25_010260 [Pseudomonas putida]|uniref:Uncharacterized protein n=1 Tax=Pseudomonas putida TaxID=303 RepID=A0AAP9MXY7_PSEPU|nr:MULTISPECIES: hypothetical protein [Pseudomonas]MBP2838642.1 hypothetical protein [Pseudomonas sp. PNP]QJQ09785.1 hypothetical protein A3L25_010260 [Pseudomonas putida]
MPQPPYEIHRDILLDGKYGTAYLLQDFVLHQYDSDLYPFDASRHLGGFDTRHLQIYKDLKRFYWKNGPSTAQLEITRTLIARRTAEAQENFDELTVLRAMRPEDYPAESGERPVDGYRSAVKACEMHHRRYAEIGFEISRASPELKI